MTPNRGSLYLAHLDRILNFGGIIISGRQPDHRFEKRIHMNTTQRNTGRWCICENNDERR